MPQVAYITDGRLNPIYRVTTLLEIVITWIVST